MFASLLSILACEHIGQHTNPSRVVEVDNVVIVVEIVDKVPVGAPLKLAELL